MIYYVAQTALRLFWNIMENLQNYLVRLVSYCINGVPILQISWKISLHLLRNPITLLLLEITPARC